MANPNISEIVTTTLEARSGKLADNVSKNNAILMRLQEKGKIKPLSGGRQIYQEIEYAENGTFGWYSGYDPINISPQDVFTTANYDWKQASSAVSINGLEQLQNSGDSQLIDLLTSRIENAEKSMKNGISTAIYGDGTANGGKALGGLQLLVPDVPNAGTVGGISRATWAFWRSIKFGGVADGGAAVSAANIQTYMNRLYLQLVRGADKTDLIMADNNYFRFYWESLSAVQRFTNEKLTGTGFTNLKYMDADVVPDGGIGGGCPANHMYFLNTDYIYLRSHSKRNFTPLGTDRFATNQDAMVKLIGWAGNMTTSGSLFQGVLIA
jgi:hypothetical protein